MPKIAFSPAFVRKAACSDGVRKTDFFDVDNPGFMLEVRCSGGKTFYQRYRDGRGKERQFKIGSAKVLSLAQARHKGRAVFASALLGSDPQQRREELRKIPTLHAFVHKSYLPFVKNAKRSWRTDETVLRIHILPALGRFPMDLVTSQAVGDLLQRMRDNGYASGTVNRVLILLRYVFNLAKRWGIPDIDQNPTTGLKTAPDVCRERFLTAGEVQRLLSALRNDENQVAAHAIHLLLLTGARRNEVTQARWEYVNWEKKTLLVPQSKTGRPRLISLNSPALDVLRSIERTPGNPYIFPSPVTGRPCASLFFPWSRIRATAGIADVRLHDLRHTFASFLVNNGVSLYVVQGLLGHTQVRTTQRYAHLADETLSDAAELVGTVVYPAAGLGAA
jgi:integrase